MTFRLLLGGVLRWWLGEKSEMVRMLPEKSRIYDLPIADSDVLRDGDSA